MQIMSEQLETPPRNRLCWRWCGCLALLAIFYFLAAFSTSAASFTATLDRDTVETGDSATLSLKFEGGKPDGIPQPPEIANLKIEYGGASQSFSFVNGESSASITANFSVTPLKPGEYLIPALRAEVDGKVLTSQPLKLTVLKPGGATGDTNPGNQLIFMKLLVPKKQVFVGEVVGIQLQLYIRDGVVNAESILGGFERYGGSPVTAEGFTTLKTAPASRRRAQIGNSIYSVATLITALAPVKTGELKIDAFNPSVAIQLPSNQRRRDMFDPFGMFQNVEERKVTLTADTETLTALPVPRENAPANFNGAIGSYALTVTAGPTNVAVGDPITLRIQLTGSGALETLALPDQPWQNFKTYPPTAKVETTDPLGIKGTKTFEQVVIPENTDIKELPAFSFSYFDSDKRAFRTLSQPAIPLIVRPGGTASVPVVAAAGHPAENSPPAQDIVSIKQRPGKLEPPAVPLIQRPVFIALQGLPALAFIGAMIWRKRTDTLANNPRLQRQRRVAQLVREEINLLRKLAAEKNSEQFFATLFHILQEQIGDRLDLPAASITEAVIEEQLQPRGIDEATLAELRSLFQSNNLARYAPVKSTEELEAVIPRLENVLETLRTIPA